MRPVAELERDLEHARLNRAHREQELIAAREAWDRAKFQYDNALQSCVDIGMELLNARLASGGS